MTKRTRARLADVAKLANVSPGVVSTVVNQRSGGIRVGAATRARVLAAVEELGYVPHPVAKSLAQGKNGILGVFTYESVFPVSEHVFYHPILIGIEGESEAQGCDLLLFSSAATEDGRRAIYRNGANRLLLADGAIFFGRNDDRDEVAQLARDGYPFVYVGRREIAQTRVSFVAPDYETATGSIVEYLHTRFRHQQIAYLAAVPNAARVSAPREARADRQRGYRRVVASLNLREMIQDTPVSEIDAAWLDTQLKLGTTAFLVENDQLGQALMGAAEEAGLVIPEHFSFAMLGNPLDLSYIPEWTSFELPMREMGRRAVQILMQLISSKDAVSYQELLPCRFRPGTTAGPAP